MLQPQRGGTSSSGDLGSCRNLAIISRTLGINSTGMPIIGSEGLEQAASCSTGRHPHSGSRRPPTDLGPALRSSLLVVDSASFRSPTSPSVGREWLSSEFITGDHEGAKATRIRNKDHLEMSASARCPQSDPGAGLVALEVIALSGRGCPRLRLPDIVAVDVGQTGTASTGTDSGSGGRRRCSTKCRCRRHHEVRRSAHSNASGP